MERRTAESPCQDSEFILPSAYFGMVRAVGLWSFHGKSGGARYAAGLTFMRYSAFALGRYHAPPCALDLKLGIPWGAWLAQRKEGYQNLITYPHARSSGTSNLRATRRTFPRHTSGARDFVVPSCSAWNTRSLTTSASSFHGPAHGAESV